MFENWFCLLSVGFQVGIVIQKAVIWVLQYMFCIRRGQVLNWSVRQFSSSFKWLKNCNSCGVTLQSEKPSGLGYYIKPETPQVGRFNTIEDVKYLLFSQEIQNAKESANVTKMEDVKESLTKPIVCKRCSSAIYQNKYDIKDFPRYSYSDIEKYLKPDSSLSNIVPLPEFPFHMDLKVLKSSKHDVSLILSKGDQLLKDKTSIQNKVPVFFKDFLEYHLNIDTNKAIAVSALRGWNIRTAYSMLKNNTYLIGNTNVGKSTFINALISKYLGYKININKFGNNEIREPLKDQKYGSIKQHILNQSAGVSHLPNMTRDIQPYQIDKKVLYDLPGYTSNMDEIHLESVIKKDWLQRVRKTSLFNTRKIKKKPYISFNGTETGACYTVGGMFFLVPPKGTINQVVKYIPGEPYQFKNVQKGLEVFKECYSIDKNVAHPLNKFCGIVESQCEISSYSRHVIPPFQGSIEIVFKDIGYILLRTTGKYQFKGFHEVWVPKGIDVCIREPLEQLIDNGFYEHVNSKGKLAACPKDRPLFSSTYIIDRDEEATLNKIQKMYLQRTENDISSRRSAKEDPLEVVSVMHNERPNLFWHYKW